MEKNGNGNIYVDMFEIPKGKKYMLPEMQNKEEVKVVLDICRLMENNGIYHVNEPQIFESSTGCEIVTAEIDTLLEDYKSHFAIICGKGEIGRFEEEAIEYLIEERFENEKLIKDNLFDLYFEEGITKIKDRTFEGLPIMVCRFPESMVELGAYAFKECGFLQTVEFNSGIKYIRKGAFEGCGYMWNITIPSTVEIIEENAFLNCEIEYIYMENKEKDAIKGAPWGAKGTTVVWEDADGGYILDNGKSVSKVQKKPVRYIQHLKNHKYL